MNQNKIAFSVVNAKTSTEISDMLILAKVAENFLDDLILDCVSEYAVYDSNNTDVNNENDTNEEKDYTKQEELIEPNMTNDSNVRNSSIKVQIDFLVASLGPNEARTKISALLEEV